METLKKSGRLRILLLTGIFPPDIGGPATYVPRIASALTERGHAITAVTLSDHTDHDDTLYPFRVVRLLRETFKPWRWLLTVWTLLRHGKDVDVLFVNGLAMEAVIANYFLRKPIVLKVVGDFAWERAKGRGWVEEQFEEFQKNGHNLKITMLKVIRNWWTRRADKVVVPSQYLAQWVSEWGISKNKLMVIYNAVKKADAIKPAEIPIAQAFKAVTVARLTSWKRIDGIIEAIAQTENVGLIVVGDGPERKRLDQIVQALKITDRVYFAGKRSKEEALALMAAADVFVLNSTYEGLPHVVLEAMSLGLPVVATEIGGTPEVVENETNGLLIPSSEKEKLKKAILKLLSHPAELRRLSAGAKNTSKRFSFGRMVEETEMVLTEVATKRGTVPRVKKYSPPQ